MPRARRLQRLTYDREQLDRVRIVLPLPCRCQGWPHVPHRFWSIRSAWIGVVECLRCHWEREEDLHITTAWALAWYGRREPCAEPMEQLELPGIE